MTDIIKGSTYQDCSPQDFAHYFCGSLMVWNISPTKKRIYIVKSLDSGIEGEYVTRDKNFKAKKLPFKDWFNHLDVIPLFPRYFNIKGAGCSWTPSLSKSGSHAGYRKSFPYIYRSDSFKMYGRPLPADMTIQNILFQGFSDIYGVPENKRPLREIVKNRTFGIVSRGDFIVSTTGGLMYKGTGIGEIPQEPKNVISLYQKSAGFKELLVEEGGAYPEMIIIKEAA